MGAPVEGITVNGCWEARRAVFRLGWLRKAEVAHLSEMAKKYYVWIKNLQEMWVIRRSSPYGPAVRSKRQVPDVQPWSNSGSRKGPILVQLWGQPWSNVWSNAWSNAWSGPGPTMGPTVSLIQQKSS